MVTNHDTADGAASGLDSGRDSSPDSSVAPPDGSDATASGPDAPDATTPGTDSAADDADLDVLVLDDPFAGFPPDASPDSRAGIQESCLRKTIPYLQAPIVPPYAAAGLDLHGGPTGNGSEGWNPADAGAFHYDPSLEGPGPLTLDQVQSVLCFPDAYAQGATPNDAGALVQTSIAWSFADFPTGGGFATDYYGTAADGGPPFVVSAIQVQSWTWGPPHPNLTYAGTIEATGADGTHFSIGLDAPITQTPSGGAVSVMEFAANASSDGGAPNASTRAMVNGLYAAMMTQFLPGSPVAPDCFASGECNACRFRKFCGLFSGNPADSVNVLIVAS
jgi:hypothetical protein